MLASLLHRHYLTDVNQTLHDVWTSPGLVHYIYIFGGSCPLTEFYQVQNSLCVQVLRSPILAALLQGTRIVVSAKLCGIQQRVPPIFGMAAITLGIDPHSSWFLFFFHYWNDQATDEDAQTAQCRYLTALSPHHYDLTIINKHYHFVTSADRFPVPVRSDIVDRLLNTCIQ